MRNIVINNTQRNSIYNCLAKSWHMNYGMSPNPISVTLLKIEMNEIIAANVTTRINLPIDWIKKEWDISALLTPSLNVYLPPPFLFSLRKIFKKCIEHESSCCQIYNNDRSVVFCVLRFPPLIKLTTTI